MRPIASLCSLFGSFFALGLASLGCGPVSGPFGSIGGEWGFVCGTPGSQGAACNYSAGCAAGLYCTEDGTSQKGTCQPRKASGASCNLSEDCQPGLACKEPPLNGTCYELVCDANNNCQQGDPTGATCSPPASDCPANQLCALEPSGPGTCAAAPGLGQSCEGFRSTFPCAPGLTCQRLTIQCVEPPAEGELCGITGPICAPGLVCRSDADPAKDGRCGPPSALGETCPSAGMCGPGAHCDLSKLKCVKNFDIGDSCSNGNECGEAPHTVQSGADCVQGKCVDTSVAGGKCWPGYDHQCSAPMTCIPKE